MKQSSEVNEKWAIMRQTQNFSLLLKVFLARTWTHIRLFAFWLGLEKILCASFCLLVIIQQFIFFLKSQLRVLNLVTVRDYPTLNSEGGEEYLKKSSQFVSLSTLATRKTFKKVFPFFFIALHPVAEVKSLFEFAGFSPSSLECWMEEWIKKTEMKSVSVCGLIKSFSD